MKIIFFDNNLEKFISNLKKETIAKAIRTIDLLEKFGNKLGLPHSKKINKDLFELRIRGKTEVRIFYTYHNLSIILLCGFIKKSQKIPKKNLKQAFKHMQTLRSATKDTTHT